MLTELFEYVFDNFVPEEQPIPVSELAAKLNALLLEKSSIKISAQALALYFEKKGLLYVEENEKGRRKAATESGVSLGISEKTIVRDNGDDYSLNLYNKEAQTYAANHIADVVTAYIAGELRETRKPKQ